MEIHLFAKVHLKDKLNYRNTKLNFEHLHNETMTFVVNDESLKCIIFLRV